MREIDHRWRGLQVVKTVEGCLKELQNYLGENLLGSAVAEGQFERQSDRAKDQLASLVFKKRLADPEDLAVMRHLLPQSFQHLETLASSKFVKRTAGAPEDTVSKLRIAVARSAQEYLFSEHQRFIERCAAAKGLREFIFDLKYRPYRKRLVGFSPTHIEQWDKTDHLEAARLRQERLREKKALQKALRPS
jgi:hypothetical protein